MLYIAPSIVLSASLGSLDCPVFLWDNLVTIDGITADHEDADFPATNLANSQTSSLYKSDSTADQDVVFDFDPNGPVNAFGIARPNFGSGSIGLKVYGKTAEPLADWVLLADLAPGDDTPIFGIVEGDYYVQGKLSFTPDAVAPQMAFVSFGTALIMPRGTPAGFVALKDALERETLTGIAENGDFLGDITTSERLSTTIDFKLLDGQWYRSTMRPFVQSGVPFFYAQSPSLLPNETGFAKFASVPKGQVNQFTGEVDVSLSIIGLAR